MENAIWFLCMIEAFKIFSLIMIWWKIDGYEEGKRQGEHSGYLQGEIDERRRQQKLDSWKEFKRAVQQKSRKEKRMKLISSVEIRTRILKAIKGEEFCGGEKCLFYHECVADKRDTDCEEFIIEMFEKGFKRSDEHNT